MVNHFSENWSDILNFIFINEKKVINRRVDQLKVKISNTMSSTRREFLSDKCNSLHIKLIKTYHELLLEQIVLPWGHF